MKPRHEQNPKPQFRKNDALTRNSRIGLNQNSLIGPKQFPQSRDGCFSRKRADWLGRISGTGYFFATGLILLLLATGCGQVPKINGSFRGDASLGWRTILEISSLPESALENGIRLDEFGDTSVTLNFKLKKKPATPVILPLDFASDQLEVSANSVSFLPENWEKAQSVILRAVDDTLPEGDHETKLSFLPIISNDANFGNLPVDPITVGIQDNDTPGFTLSRPETLATTEGGASDVFTVRMNTNPAEPVSLRVETNRTQEAALMSESGTGSACVESGGSPADHCLLEFTPGTPCPDQGDWCAIRTIVVPGQNDDIDDGDQDYQIEIQPAVSADENYSSLDPEDIPGQNADDDQFGVSISQTNFQVDEGEVSTFSIQLNSEPLETVTLDLTVSSDTFLEVFEAGGICGSDSQNPTDTCQVSFTTANWDTPQTVTARATDDNLLEPGGPATTSITVGFSSGDDLYATYAGATLNWEISDNETGKRLYLAGSSLDGDLGSAVGADTICQNIILAKIGEIPDSLAALTTTSGRGFYDSFSNNTNYYRATDGVFVGTSTAGGVLPATLSAPFSTTSGDTIWTGIGGTDTCNNWSAPLTNKDGVIGDATSTNLSTATNDTTADCDGFTPGGRQILCVEQ